MITRSVDHEHGDDRPQRSLLAELVSVCSLVCVIFSTIVVASISNEQFSACVDNGSLYYQFHQVVVGVFGGTLASLCLGTCLGVADVVRNYRHNEGALLDTMAYIQLTTVVLIVVVAVALLLFATAVLWHHDPHHSLIFWPTSFFRWPELLHDDCSNDRVLYRLAAFSDHWLSTIMLVAIARATVYLLGFLFLWGMSLWCERHHEAEAKASMYHNSPPLPSAHGL